MMDADEQYERRKRRGRSVVLVILCAVVVSAGAFFFLHKRRTANRYELLLAAAEGHLETVDALLRAGTSPNVTGAEGITPLYFAAGDPEFYFDPTPLIRREGQMAGANER